MLLKRVYDETDLTRYEAERKALTAKWYETLRAAGVSEDLLDAMVKQQVDTVIAPPKLAGVEIEHTGVDAEQHFSTSLVTEYVKLGIMEIAGNRLTLHAAQADLHYTIVREPGRWCLHCGEKLPDDVNGEMARLHMAMKHNGAPSPDESNPAGYKWLTYFECALDAAEHDRWQKRDHNG
ncbi:hypothetical protein FBQ81_03265 [Chloroflexi bacterium CFX6]|nr:hypothetical protein [Chloroflexi bacterium CFX6]